MSMRTAPLLAATMLAALAVADAGAGSLASHGWGSMGPFSIGMTQAAVYKQHGYGSARKTSTITTYPILQGVVSVAFVGGKVADLECGAAHLLEPCPQGFVLPDGTADNTRVPKQKHWRSYTMAPGGTDSFTMSRVATASGGKIEVILTVTNGRVAGVQLYPARASG